MGKLIKKTKDHNFQGKCKFYFDMAFKFINSHIEIKSRPRTIPRWMQS